MPGVLEVSALQLGHPVCLSVLVEAGDALFQAGLLHQLAFTHVLLGPGREARELHLSELVT